MYVYVCEVHVDVISSIIMLSFTKIVYTKIIRFLNTVDRRLLSILPKKIPPII